MTQPTERRRRSGRPPKITRRQILDAAREIIAKDGVQGLTMRRLAQTVGTTAMAIYYHVKNREELILLLFEEFANSVERRPLPEEPRERLLASAQLMHDVLASCAWTVEVLAAGDLIGASGMWIVEGIIDSAVRCGLDPHQAVHAYRAIWYYTAGEILIRSASERRRTESDRPLYRDQVFASLDEEASPWLAALSGRWEELTAQDTFRYGLEALVTGLLSTGSGD